MNAIQTSRRRSALLLFPSGLLFVLLPALVAPTAPASEPGPSPHRYIPARALTAYVEFDGLDAHADAWKATACRGILVDTPAGSMLTEVAKQVLDRMLSSVPNCKLTGADLVTIQAHLLHHGFVAAVHDLGEGQSACTVILRDHRKPPVRASWDRLLQQVLPAGEPKKPRTPVRLRGREIFQVGNEHENKPAAAPGLDDLPAVPAVPAEPGKLLLPPPSLPAVPPSPPGPVGVSAPPPEGVLPAVPAVPAEPGNLLLPPPSLPMVPPPPPVALSAAGAPGLSWWFEGDDLVLLLAPDQDSPAVPDLAQRPERSKPKPHVDHRSAIFDAIEGKQPNVATHPAYVSALAEGKDVRGFQPDGLFFLEWGSGKGPFAGMDDGRDPLAMYLSALGMVLGQYGVESLMPGLLGEPKADQPAAPGAKQQPDPTSQLGLDGLKRIVGRWGFQGKALFTDVRLEAPAPRKGLVALLDDQPSFRKDQLPPVPRNTRAFLVDSLDVAATYRRLVGVLQALDPEAEKPIGQFEQAFRQTTGWRFREDVLGALGPHWSVFRLPSQDENRGDKQDLDPTEYALVAGVRDAREFEKRLDSIAKRINESLLERDQPAQGKDAGPPILALERLPAPAVGYQLTSPARLVPWLGDKVRPTILVSKSFVAFASNPERAREALASEAGPAPPWKPAGELAEAFECLPESLTFVLVGDHRDSPWPDALAHLPGTIQFASAMFGETIIAAPPTSDGLLGLLGIPGRDGFRLRLDPSRIPRAVQIEPFLFPSVLAAAVDDRGYRLILREAFPLACLGKGARTSATKTWSSSRGLEEKLKVSLGLHF